MPYRRRYRRRRYGRKRNMLSRVPRPFAALPKVVRMPYFYENNYNTTNLSGTGTTKVWRINGPYDPEAALGGHQPLGWDQMSNFYSWYNAIACRIRWTIRTTLTESLNMVTWLTDQASEPTPTNIQAHETAKIRVSQIPAGEGAGVKYYVDSGWQFAYKYLDVERDLQNLHAVNTSLPVTQVYLHSHFSELLSPSAGDVYVAVFVEYVVEWSNRTVPPTDT